MDLPGRLCKCLNPGCLRKVREGAGYCCEACQASAEDRAPWELRPHDPGEVNQLLVHSAFCERLRAGRGEYALGDADGLWP